MAKITGQLICTRRRAWVLAFGALLLAGQLVLLVHVSSGLTHDPSCPVCQVAHTPAMSAPVLPVLAQVDYSDAPPTGVDAASAVNPPIAPSQRGPPTLKRA